MFNHGGIVLEYSAYDLIGTDRSARAVSGVRTDAHPLESAPLSDEWVEQFDCQSAGNQRNFSQMMGM